MIPIQGFILTVIVIVVIYFADRRRNKHYKDYLKRRGKP